MKRVLTAALIACLGFSPAACGMYYNAYSDIELASPEQASTGLYVDSYCSSASNPEQCQKGHWEADHK